MADDRTAFLIEMAAKLTGGESSAAGLSVLGSKMVAAGASAAELEAAVTRTSRALEDAGKATAVASDALTAGEGKYRQLEGSAVRSAKAVERLSNAVDAARDNLAVANLAGDPKAYDKALGKLRQLEDRKAEAVAKSQQAAGALLAEAHALDALKNSAAGATANEAKLAQGLKALKTAATETAKAEAATKGSGKVNEIAEAFGKLGGPLGFAGQQAFGLATGFAKLGTSIGSMGPYIAAAAVFLAVATAALAGTVAIGKWSVGLADAGRTAQLLTAGLAGTVEGGLELDDTITKLGNVVPQTREELLAMAGDLRKTGLQGAELSSALEEAAIKAATLKFGPEFGKQMLALDVQSKRFSTNIGKTFGGLKIDGLLAGFSKLVGLFDASTASGATLKFLFEEFFQPLIDGAADSTRWIERLFIQAEILALKAYIGLKPWSEEIKLVGKVLLIGAAIIVGVFAAAVIGFVGSIVAAVAQIGLLFYALVKVGQILYTVAAAIIEGFGPALDWMSSLGSNMIDGLVNGLIGGAGAVVKAITGVVGGAVDAAKHALGIASPSKVFAGLGDYTAQGFAEGVEGGTGDAHSAVEAMVAPPNAGGAGGGARAGASIGGVQVTFVIEGGGKGADEIVSKAREMLIDLFEGGSLMLGGGEAAT